MINILFILKLDKFYFYFKLILIILLFNQKLNSFKLQI